MFTNAPLTAAAILTLGVLVTTEAVGEGDAMGVGEAAFVEHCAVCHGASGTGDGPFTPLLRAPPPDLTLLSQANGGEFPDSRVRRAVDGRAMPGAHGTTEMPIWGRVWHKAGEPEAGVRARLIAVVAYLLTIQK